MVNLRKLSVVSKYIRIYLIHVKDFGIYFFRQLLGVRVIHPSPSFSTVYTHRWTLSRVVLLLYYYTIRYTAYSLSYHIIIILLSYHIHPILYQHFYKCSTREYQLIIDVVITTHRQWYYVHMPLPVRCNIFRYGLGCYCIICHVARWFPWMNRIPPAYL